MNNTIANEQILTKYRIYIKIFGYGQCLINCNSDNVKRICEEYIKKYTNCANKVVIDVCNTYTGETRRIWQNQNQTFLQFPTGQSPHMERN